MRGIYIVLAALNQPVQVEVSNKHKFTLDRGFYGYVGSALGSLETRIARHLSVKKKYHWHIDYLLCCATVCMIIYAETKIREECYIAQALSQRLPSVPHFGCSDCGCLSHLFLSKDFTDLKKHVIYALKQRNLKPLEILGSSPRRNGNI